MIELGGLECIAEYLGQATPVANSKNSLFVYSFVYWAEWNSKPAENRFGLHSAVHSTVNNTAHSAVHGAVHSTQTSINRKSFAYKNTRKEIVALGGGLD